MIGGSLLASLAIVGALLGLVKMITTTGQFLRLPLVAVVLLLFLTLAPV